MFSGFQGLPGTPGQKGLSGPKVVFLISYNLYVFLKFLDSKNLTATLVVSAQGDSGQPGLPGTMGPAGKTVSMHSTCVETHL